MALYKGVSIVDIMKAADWRSTNTFYRHYGLDLWKKREGQFNRAVFEFSDVSQSIHKDGL